MNVNVAISLLLIMTLACEVGKQTNKQTLNDFIVIFKKIIFYTLFAASQLL